MPVRALPPIARPIAVIGRLARPIAIACQTAPPGRRATSSTRAFGVARHPAAHAHHDRERERLGDQPLLRRAQRDVEVPGVVDLELRLDPELAHPGRQSPHAVGRVAELAHAEAHRARVQRRHPRPRLDELLALLERQRRGRRRSRAGPAPGTLLDQRRRPALRSRGRRSARPPRPGGGCGRPQPRLRVRPRQPPRSPPETSGGSGCRAFVAIGPVSAAVTTAVLIGPPSAGGEMVEESVADLVGGLRGPVAQPAPGLHPEVAPRDRLPRGEERASGARRGTGSM